MADKSSYLRFLPPVLWENEAPAPALSLGAALRIFEKILSGIDDTAAVVHGDHEHVGIEQAIAQIYRLFQPWATPTDFLPWLASWVALDLDPIWDEYQQRKLISQMVQIYKLRGLKPGLQLFLELHTVAGTRPRITVDDCSKILTMDVVPGRASKLATLVSQRPLIHPLCVAAGPDGSLFVGDHGTLVDLSWSPTSNPAVFRFRGPSGDYPYSAHPPHETPIGLGAPAWTLHFPVAIAIEGTAASFRVYVLDHANAAVQPALYRLDSASDFAVATPLANLFSNQGGRPGLGLHWPMAMAFDAANNLLILDRGAPPGSPAAPRIVEVQKVQVGPAVVVSHALSGIPIVEPTCLVVLADGSLVVGDAGVQPDDPPDPQQVSPPYASFFAPADLVSIDRNAGYLASSLLGGIAPTANPLVAPQAVVIEDPSHLLVVDSGVRPFRTTIDQTQPFLKTIAELPAVYRVDLSTAPPTVTLASDRAELVSPVGAVMSGTELFIVDHGDFAAEGLGSTYLRVWRAVSDGNGVPVDHEMGVTIYFALPRPPAQGVAPPPPTVEERFRVVENIGTIIDSEKPAHIRWTKIFQA